MKEWSDETYRAILESAERKTRLAKLTNKQLAGALMELWRETPLMTWQSDLIDEVTDRLSVWDAEPSEIRAKIDAELDAAAEGFDADRVMDRAKELMEGEG